MSTPQTRIDERFSDPGASAVSWEETRGLLEAAEISWISTVRPDGRPHVTPLVAAWVGDALYFHTGSGEQKRLNLRANPQVVLTTGCNRWDGGVDVVVEGEAVRVTDDAELAAVAAAYAAKWDGRWQLTASGGRLHDGDGDTFASEAFRVRPTRVFAHAKGDPFGATTHRF